MVATRHSGEFLELDNTDKHRTIFTIGQDTLFTADWIDAPFPEYLVKAGDPHFTGVFDSAVEARGKSQI